MAAHNSAVCRLCVLFLLLVSTTTISSAASTPDPSSLCAMPSDAPKHIPAGKDDALPLLRSLELNSGYFFGGEDIHFAKDHSNETSYYASRSFSLLPLHVDRTANSTLFHVGATMILHGARSHEYFEEGYYYSNTAELCMTGTGSYYHEDDGSNARLLHVGLHLRVPNPASITDPFVTGRLRAADFDTISLVAYAEGDVYKFGESAAASCPPPSQPPATPRGGKDLSCAHLKGELVGLYKLQHASSSGGASRLRGLRLPGAPTTMMHVGQVQCDEDGGVRAYAAFSNDTSEQWRLRMLPSRGPPRPPLVVGGEVVVAEGRWDPARRMLCLRACRVVRSETTSVVVVDKECGVGMSFWFPGVWTIRDRSAVTGMLWNTSGPAGGSSDGSGGVISVSSTSAHIHRSNFSDVKYSYNDTMVEEAKKRYLASELSSPSKKNSGSFKPPNNYTYQDFEFRFYGTARGEAYPVTIGSTIVYGDQLVADDSFSRDTVVDVKLKKHELLNVSYDINLRRAIRPKGDRNGSYSIVERKVKAEGVFDPKTGILCMVACRELNSSVTDCQILITVHFASLDEAAEMGHGRGAISSLRNKKTDPLFFEKIEIRLFGVYREQAFESVSRMDMESIMLVISTTLPCVFTVLQILHVKRRPEAAAATSITMLVVLALGYVAPLVLSSEALFLSRRSMYMPFPFESYVPYELSQAMMRAPTLIALLLLLRLIQLAWSARKKTAGAEDGSKAAASSAAERRSLWLCVPLYLIGGALTIVVHMLNAHRAAAGEASSLTVRLGPAPATLWEDLVSSAGLALGAFLLPQIAMNVIVSATGIAGVTAALSPWFYAGGTVVRAMPHVYDVIRARGYVQSIRPSYIYASPRYDRFGDVWDVVLPCVAALLALLLFLQQRVRLAAAPLFPSRRRLSEYEMVSNL
ncbi:unnamed protein product [Urochloa humidicola]